MQSKCDNLSEISLLIASSLCHVLSSKRPRLSITWQFKCISEILFPINLLRYCVLRCNPADPLEQWHRTKNIRYSMRNSGNSVRKVNYTCKDFKNCCCHVILFRLLLLVEWKKELTAILLQDTSELSGSIRSVPLMKLLIFQPFSPSNSSNYRLLMSSMLNFSFDMSISLLNII